MKKTLLLLAIFTGLALFVYFYEIKGGEQRQAAQDQEESLVNLQEAQITAFEIERPNQPLIRLEKQGSRWRLVQPVDAAVDGFAADALSRDLLGAKKVRTFEEVEDPSIYGLHEPSLRLSVYSGDKRYIVRLGKNDYTGNQMYAQLEGQTAVHLIHRSLFASADKKLNDWRSKSVLDFEQDLVQVAELERPQGRLKLEKRGESWHLAEPIEDLADDNVVSSMLSSVKYARVDKFLEEQPTEAQLQEYGLAQPRYLLRVRQQGEDNWRQLQLGEKTGDGYYARDLNRPNVFTVKESVRDSLTKKAEEFRDKKIIKVRQDDLETFELSHKEVELVKIQREGSDFTIVEPESEAGSRTAPFKFWYPLTDIRFQTVERRPSPPEDPRFSQPDVTLTLTSRSGEKRSFQFVQNENLYLARKLEDGRVGTIEAADFNKLKLDPPSLVTE